MTTAVSDPIRYIATEWEDNCGYKSATLSGIVPDAAHLKNGGYHCSVEDLVKYGNGTDYSNTRPDDKNFNPKYGAAIDMSMSTSDMVLCHSRVYKVWADKTDPRRQYINAINTWDGTGDAVRLDCYANTAKTASADHKWHNHQETRRRHLLDWTAARAIVSVLKGETKEQYMADAYTQGDRDIAWATTNRAWALIAMLDAATYKVNGDTKARVEPNLLKQSLQRIEAAQASSATREQSMLAAIAKLAEGGSNIDTAVIVKAVNDAGEKTNAAVAALQADLDAAQAENHDLRAQLAAALAPNE